MIDRSDDLPITRQAKLLGISRGSVYYQSRAISDADLAIMRRMDELHLEYPFAGSDLAAFGGQPQRLGADPEIAPRRWSG